MRHRRRRDLDEQGVPPIPNIDRFGNAAFCDGHAESITRKMLHDPSKRHIDPLKK